MNLADIHVLPVNDLMAHEEIRQCWCRPTVDADAATPIVVHHSADGREYFERDAVVAERGDA